MSTSEFEQLLADFIQNIQSDIDAYEERVALSGVDDGLTTDQRAIQALERPERFPGEHLVARMWLQHSRTARMWTKPGGNGQ